MIGKIATAVLVGALTYEAEAGDLKLMRNDQGTNEVQTYFDNSKGRLTIDEYMELVPDGLYSETGVQLAVLGKDGVKLKGAFEYTAIEGTEDHARIGLQSIVDLGNVDLMLRAMYDDQQDLHVRVKMSGDTPIGSLTYLLANMDANGNTHQRITYQTPKLDKIMEGMYAFTQMRLTSGDGEGPTFYVGVGLN